MPESRTEPHLLAFSASLAEAAWLVCLAALPLVVNLFADGTFEPPKVRLLQSVSWLLAGALLLTLGLRGRQLAAAARHNPIALAALAVGLSACVSTALSLAPAASLWGSFERGQGLSTTLCYLLVFAAVGTGVRTIEQAWRLIGAIVVAGTLVAIVGLGQQLGVDPLQMAVDPTRRAPSTLGNPIFMAAYLGFGILLAIATAAASRGVSRLLWGAAAMLQGLAFIGAGSRGPTIGLLAGLGLLVWLLALRKSGPGSGDDLPRVTAPARRWRTAGAIGAVFLVLVLAVLVGPLRANLERLGGLSNTSTIQVRLDAWEAVSRTMLAPRSTAAALRTDWPGWRMPFGYGLETASYPLGLHISSDLPALTRNDDRLDRAHNVVLQQLVERGSIGVVVLLALWFLLLRTAINAALPDSADAAAAAAPTTASAMLAVATGLLVPWLVFGSVAWSGLGAATALTTVVLWPLLANRSRPGQPAGRGESRDPRRVLLAGVATALLAHFVELQSGVAVTPTSLAFWALAGLLASPWGRGETPEAQPEPTDWSPWVAGFAAGTLLGSLTPPASSAGLFESLRTLLGAPEPSFGTAGLVIACLVAASLLAAARVEGPRLRATAAATALSVAVATVLLASAPLDLAPVFREVAPTNYTAALTASGLIRTALAVLLVLALAIMRTARSQDPSSVGQLRTARALLGLALLGAIGGPQAWSAAAATFGGIAGGDAQALRSEAAVSLYRSSLTIRPSVAARWRGLARTHRAAIDHDMLGTMDHLAEAQDALERAALLTPLESEVHGELGSILLQHAISSAGDPAPSVDSAIAHLRRAAELRPASQRAQDSLQAALTLQIALSGERQ